MNRGDKENTFPKMSKVRVTFTEKFFIIDHTITYHGVLIPLYGLLDEFINIFYINIVSDDVKLHYELKFKNGLSIEQKLRLIAETDRGRLIIKEFSEFGTNASFAEAKRRFVPDWYINPNGPISSLTTGNHSYSEYYYLPLNSEERWKRYVGTLPPSVPLFVSLFQQTSNVIARIISRSPSRSTSRDSTPYRGSRDSTPDGGPLSLDGSLTVDAGEISSPLRVPASPTDYEKRAALAFDQASIGELSTLPLAPQSESEILITEEVISKKDWSEEMPSAPSDHPPNLRGDFPPSYGDHEKDVLVRYNPSSHEDLPIYNEISTEEIGTYLTPPYNVKEFMKNALSIQYVKTEHEIYELVKDRNFQKYFPSNFDFKDRSDIDIFRHHVVKAYIRLVSSLGYKYANFVNLQQLFRVQQKYFHDQDPENIKDQIASYNVSDDEKLIEYELTPEQIERQKELIAEDIKTEEARIKHEITEKNESTTADRILSESIGSARIYARKLLKLIADNKELEPNKRDPKPIKLMYSPKLNSPEDMGDLINLIKHGSLTEIKELWKAYNDEPIPSSKTLRSQIGEYIKEKLYEMNKPKTKHLIDKFNIGTSGGWTAFTN